MIPGLVRLNLPPAEGMSVRLNGRPLRAAIGQEEGLTVVRLRKAAVLEEGDALVVG